MTFLHFLNFTPYSKNQNTQHIYLIYNNISTIKYYKNIYFINLIITDTKHRLSI